MQHLLDVALDRLIVRKDHTLCTQCYERIPIHPGDGTPASSFILALQNIARQHRACAPSKAKTSR